MALAHVRSGFARFGAIKTLLGNQVHPSASVSPIQVATLKATYGDPYPYEKPYPYETKGYNMITEFFDKTAPRICENSKIIVVDGNIGTGKNAFAKRLAKNFDLRYYESVTDDYAFIQPEYGFDLRELNEFLPERAKFYDLKRFLADPHPERGVIGRLQIQWYREKFRIYIDALRHLHHTGQGSVIVRSAFSDHVFAAALHMCGYASKNFVKYYHDIRDNSLCDLLKPHLCIYLDAPIDVVKQRIKERGNPDEVNSKVLNDKFLKALDVSYREKFLIPSRRYSEVVEIDWTEVADDIDMDAICEEIETLDLECHAVDEDKFHDWYKTSEDLHCARRRMYSNKFLLHKSFSRDLPNHCDEIMPHRDDLKLIGDIVYKHPTMKYDQGWATQLGHSVFLKF